MTQKTKIGLLSAFAILATAIPLTITNSIAQETKTDQQSGQGQFGQPPPQGGAGAGGFGGPPQGGPGQRPGQPGQGGFGGGGMMMGGGGGGGTAMVDDGSYLFIVQGGRVFKLNKGDLKVVAQGDLPRPQMGGGPGGGGDQPPRFGGGGGEKTE